MHIAYNLRIPCIQKAKNMEEKKKLVQINTVCNNSTGRIMGDIQRHARAKGYDTVSFVGRRKPFPDLPCEKIGSPFSFWCHVAVSTALDRQGYGSFFTTKKLVKRLREENPDIIHLHNLHGYYMNLPVLFRYLADEYKGKIFWTFHDCWPFTGHCPHFAAAGCNKWKTGCHHCACKTQYPVSLFLDASKSNYNAKKKMFCSLNTKTLTVIVPSQWMADWARDSFFSGYDIRVINNGIDLECFSYSPDDRLRARYGIPENKKILLGVASVWDQRKGLADFIELAGKVPEQYCIMLIGLSKSQIKRLPPGITGIERIGNSRELAAHYSLADIFINPSAEESFSLVTVEAFACGTPVIVLDTSAVKELVCPDNGVVLHEHTPEEYVKAIATLTERELTRERVAATAEKYDRQTAAEKVLMLYEENS